jgi:hypothetical protein
MPGADTDTTAQPDPDMTLSALAARLGELEPLNEDDDLEPVHVCRVDALKAVAQILPVRTAADAALALSLVARIHDDVSNKEHSGEERKQQLAIGTAILAQIARWLMKAYGASPLRTSWPRGATPFPETSTRDPAGMMQILREFVDRLRPPLPDA